MSRKKRKEEHVNHERWLISYADFITLLFAFFVVLFSSAQVDHRKVGQLAMAIQVAFEQLGVFESSNTRMPLEKTEPMPFEKVQVVENALRDTDISQIAPPMSGVISNAPDPQGIANLRATLEKTLAKQIEQKSVVIRQDHEGLVISLREIGFFDSGSDTLRPGSEAAIKRIAEVLAKISAPIRIEGHTDNVPIHNKKFASNWELSTARATEIVRLFITKYGFDPERLQAAGYAQYHPVDSNSTPQGRANNRRVDIVVLTPTSNAAGDSAAVETPKAAPAMPVIAPIKPPPLTAPPKQ